LNRATQLPIVLFALGLFAAYSIYKPFLLPIIVAILLALATTNVTRAITKYVKSKKIATVVMTILMVFLILAPIAYIATTGIKYASNLDFNSLNTILDKAKELLDGIPYVNKYSKEYLTIEKIQPIAQDITVYIGALGTKGIGFIKDSFLVVVFYSFIVYNQDRVTQFLRNIISSNKASRLRMVDEVSSTMEIVFYSIIVTAIFEGLLFGIFISFYGFNGLFLGFVYGFASLIPVVGGLIVWLPVSLLAWSKIDANAAITIALYSIIVISIIADTFIKPMIIKLIKDKILKTTANVDELLIFFSILAGMGSYGFWGMILGPAITTFLIVATRSYLEEDR